MNTKHHVRISEPQYAKLLKRKELRLGTVQDQVYIAVEQFLRYNCKRSEEKRK